MWAVIRSNKVIATMNIKPSQEDLATRNEHAVECENHVMPGMLYENKTFKEVLSDGE